MARTKVQGCRPWEVCRKPDTSRDFALNLPQSEVALFNLAYDETIRHRSQNHNTREKKIVKPWSNLTADEKRRLVADRVLGYKGQRAAARKLSVPMTVVSGNGGDERANLILPSGVKVDVCTRELPKYSGLPQLLLNVDTPPNLELAMLMLVWISDECEPAFCGWLWEWELRAIGRVTDYGDTAYAANISELRDFETLRYATPTSPPVAVETPGLWS
jgi:hypothetical protein